MERGVGTGQFGAVQLVDASINAYGPSTADLNGDGFEDIIATTTAGDTKVLLSNGNGTFSTASVATGSAWRVQAVDLNQDGKLDLITSAGTFAFGNGNGTFAAVQSINGLSGISLGQDGFLADVDNNGSLDFLGRDGSGNVQISYATSPGVFGTATAAYTLSSYGISGPIYGNEVGDLNGDGRVDLFFGKSLNDGGGSWIALGQAGGTFSSPVTVGALGLDGVSAKFVDFDHDGNMDIFQSDGSTLYNRIYFGNGNGTFRTPLSFFGVSVIAVVEDFNGDGYHDFLMNGFTNAQSSVYLNNKAGGFTLSQTLASSSNGNHTANAGDFNGDGALDLVLGDYDLGSGHSGLRIHFGIKEDTNTIAVFNLTTQQKARESLDRAGTLLTTINSQRGSLGSTLSRLDSMNRQITSRVTEYTAALSRIMDADIAQEAARSVGLRIKQEIGASLLGQVNNDARLVLNLLRS
jgi:flagellin-like hook-associated protein FlgL